MTLKEDGKSNKDIAKMVKVSDRTVRMVLQKYRETGSVTPKKKCGHPSSTSERYDRR